MTTTVRSPYASLIEKVQGEEMNHAIPLTPWLDQEGTDLTIASVGTPTFYAGPDELLEISNVEFNASSWTSRKKGTIHAAGRVIFCRFEGGTRGQRYEIEFPFTTSDGQVLTVIQPVYVI